MTLRYVKFRMKILQESYSIAEVSVSIRNAVRLRDWSGLP
jgi:hypothetical protein